MRVSTTSCEIEGVISGLAAGYWGIYTVLWTYTYMKAHRTRKLPLSLMGKSFYLIALLYQLFAIVYFTAYCIASCARTETTLTVASICEVLYLPQAYLMGMSCSLGYGTLHTRFSGKQMAVLAVIWTAIFLGCILNSQESTKQASAIILISGFAFQLLVTVHTLWLLSKKHRQRKEAGYSDDAVNLHKSLRQFWFIFLLCVVLFVLDTVYDLARWKPLSELERAGLWVGFVVVTTVVNSWILLLLRPNERVGDVAQLACKLDNISLVIE